MPNPIVIHSMAAPDLMKYPSFIEASNPDEWSTIGDLHSNPLTLLYFMIARGAVVMQPNDYEEYAKLYIRYMPRHNTTDTTSLAAMDALLAKATVVPGARIREDGGDFTNCGRDDTAMTALIDKFIQGGGIFEAIASNHGIKFIEKMEMALNASVQNGVRDDGLFINLFNHPDEFFEQHANSFDSIIGLQKALLNGTITPQTLIERYDRYKKRLKIFSYDYAAELNGAPVIYSHAPISRQYIVRQAWDMGCDIPLPTAANYPTHVALPIIDAINSQFQIMADRNDITSLTIDGYGQDSFFYHTILEGGGNPGDDQICNIHGYDDAVYGRRISLHSLCGLENSRRTRFIPAGLTYTKTYVSREAALRAKEAGRLAVATRATSTACPATWAAPSVLPSPAKRTPPEDTRYGGFNCRGLDNMKKFKQ